MTTKTTKPNRLKAQPKMSAEEHAALHAAAEVTGDFAAGVRQQAAPAMPKAASFAEGQRDLPAEANDSSGPDFARGLRQQQSDQKKRPDYARGLRHEHDDEKA
jgi:hypothetical protein